MSRSLVIFDGALVAHEMLPEPHQRYLEIKMYLYKEISLGLALFEALSFRLVFLCQEVTAICK